MQHQPKQHATYRVALLAIVTLLCAHAAYAQSGFTIKDNPGVALDILLDGNVAVRYAYQYVPSNDAKSLTATNRPFLHLYDQQGKRQLTNSGTGGEFPHHRGIMIGWTKTGYNGKLYNFWAVYNNAQVHRSFAQQKADSSGASFVSLVDWNTHDGATIIKEQRTVNVTRGPAPAWLCLDVTSTLTAPLGEVNLNGDPEHAGVQFRANDAIKRQPTIFAYPGADADAHKILDPAWLAAQFTLDGKNYSVAQLNHASAPTGTRVSAYRNYCRFGYFPAPVTVTPTKPYTLTYRFLVYEGNLPPAAALQKAAHDYTGKAPTAPEVTIRPAENK